MSMSDILALILLAFVIVLPTMGDLALDHLMAIRHWGPYDLRSPDQCPGECWYPSPPSRLTRAWRDFRSRLWTLHYDLHRALTAPSWSPICRGFDGPCFRWGRTTHRGTTYADQDRNWKVLCPDCADAEQAHWEEMWTNYWRSVL